MKKIFYLLCVCFLNNLFALAQTNRMKIDSNGVEIGGASNRIFYSSNGTSIENGSSLLNVKSTGVSAKYGSNQLNLTSTGTYSVQTSVADLGASTYIVKVTSGGQIESKQLIIN